MSIAQQPGFSGTFTVEQTKQLLAPINPRRVLADGRGHSHVSQQDVTAHLIRVFGFGNFATELLDLECLFEQCRDESVAEVNRRKYDVAYRATMRLTVFDKDHNVVSTYEDASVGDASNQTRADGHDLAMKSAISLAKKRCCINLGDQFGLSLYNKGQTAPLVMGTKVLPRGWETAGDEQKDLQADVPKQESLGVDEVEREQHRSDERPTASDEQEKMLEQSLGATKIGEESPEIADGHPQDDSTAGSPRS